MFPNNYYESLFTPYLQLKLAKENVEFRKAMAEYESTIEELTAQIGKLREIKRERGLLEEELQTLAATLGRVQLEKGTMEKEMASQKTELEKIQSNVDLLKVKYLVPFCKGKLLLFKISQIIYYRWKMLHYRTSVKKVIDARMH